MVTFEPGKAYLVPREEGNRYYKEGSCLHDDTKPTGLANGSILKEMDTGTVYMYDEDGEQWLPFE